MTLQRNRWSSPDGVQVFRGQAGVYVRVSTDPHRILDVPFDAWRALLAAIRTDQIRRG